MPRLSPRLSCFIRPTLPFRSPIISNRDIVPPHDIVRLHLARCRNQQSIRRFVRFNKPRVLPSDSPSDQDRHPNSEESTQSAISMLDVFGDSPPPANAVDRCLADGFELSNGLTIGGSGGVILVNGEAFEWRPWEVARPRTLMVDEHGHWKVPVNSWSLLQKVWPRPDLLILGMGPSVLPINKETRRHISELGVRLVVLSTEEAAAHYNLLATERGVWDVAAALIPREFKLPDRPFEKRIPEDGDPAGHHGAPDLQKSGLTILHCVGDSKRVKIVRVAT